jgi:hypothetical protein
LATEAVSVRDGLQAALGKVLAKFGGHDLTLGQMHVIPSNDTLGKILPLVLQHGGSPPRRATVAMICFQTRAAWRDELKLEGFCYKTLELCSALASTPSGYRPEYEEYGRGSVWGGGSESSEGSEGWIVGPMALKRDYMSSRMHRNVDEFCGVLIRWTCFAPWEFEITFPGSLKVTFLVCRC